MKSTLLLTILGTFIFGCHRGVNSTERNVFSTDNRVLITDGLAPFSSIGKLDVGCTGTMIGKKLLLTAGHCVINDNSLTPRTDFKKFVANMINGAGAATATPVRAWVGGATPEQERRMDWAIVELSTALGDIQGEIPVSAKDLTNLLPYQVNLGGYNSDLADGKSPSVHWGCSILSIVEGKVHHDCDASTGISGAPLFVKEDGMWKIVGISVSEFRQNLNPPVHRDAWTEDYSNVGVPASLFAPTVEALLRTVDLGEAVPVLQSGIIAVNYVSNPSPQPQRYFPPELDRNPLPAFGNIPYQVSQVSELSKIYDKIETIHNLHWGLIANVRRFGELARAANVLYYVQISDIFGQVLSKHVAAYNRLGQYGTSSMSQEYLYQVYVALKSGQNQMQTINLNYLPQGIAFETIETQRNSAGLLAELEEIVFN
jgi:V8-like Glu-specific endopeptidase